MHQLRRAGPRGRLDRPDLHPATTLPRYAGLVATPAESAARRARRAAAAKPPAAATTPGQGDDVGQEQSEFADDDGGLTRIDGGQRTSLIVDPADGRLPYTEAGRRLAEAASRPDPHAFDGPENRPASERCLVAPNGQEGPPLLSGPDDNLVQIVETPGAVGVLTEMIHDLRLVRMGGAHAAVRTHPLQGDAIGRWEGETLVIETVDQNPFAASRETGGGVLWISPDAKVTERLRRTSPTEILYRFTVEDPAVYARPWTGEAVLRRVDKPVFEYACHEGNYALANALSGARAAEKPTRGGAEAASAGSPASAPPGRPARPPP